MGEITIKTYTMVILHIKTAMLYNETMKTTQILFTYSLLRENCYFQGDCL